MPAITFTTKGPEAANLYNISSVLKGDDAQYAARAAVREKILATWPELDAEHPEDRAEEADYTAGEKDAARLKRLREDTRAFQISGTEQTAFAEGFLKFIKDPAQIDKDKDMVMDLARLLRCRKKFLEKHMAKTQIREFTESDDEVEVDDEEPVAAT